MSTLSTCINFSDTLPWCGAAGRHSHMPVLISIGALLSGFDLPLASLEELSLWRWQDLSRVTRPPMTHRAQTELMRCCTRYANHWLEPNFSLLWALRELARGMPGRDRIFMTFLMGLGGCTMGRPPPNLSQTPYGMVCMEEKACPSAEPSSPCPICGIPRSSRSRIFRSEMAQLSPHQHRYENHTLRAPRFHVLTSISPLSSLNNQNFCPV